MAHLLQTAGLAERTANKDPISEQLERLLAHPVFRNSKRCPVLLRYLVEHQINNGGVHLKERTLGIEVFGRKNDYDTSTDPIVRTTASEIRKRLAQYYHEFGHESEVVIELPAGSYAPEFRVPSLAPLSVVARQPARWNTWMPWSLVGVVCLAAVCVGAFVWRSRAQPSALDEFWNPVVGSSQAILIGVSAGCSQSGAVSMPLTELLPRPPRVGEKQPPVSPGQCSGFPRMAFHDAIAFARVVGVLQSRQKLYEIRRAALVNFTEMQERPTVLVGGFGNGWSMHFWSQMRYRFTFDTERDLAEIVDTKNPSVNYWGIPTYWQDLPPEQITKDYGLLSRVTDPSTGQTVVIVAGVGAAGTVAVSEFLSDPKYMRELRTQAPGDWSKKNIQVVIRTEVINGNSGPPKIIASNFW